MTDCWTLGFAGKGDVTEDNAAELLDTWLPGEIELQALVPERIPRTHKGLRTVTRVLENQLSVPQITCDDSADMLTRLRKFAKDEQVYLVVLGVDDDQTTALAEQALDAGIQVKDLCAALDDVVLDEEPTPPAEPAKPRPRGRPRQEKTVEAQVAGPATIVPNNLILQQEEQEYLLIAAQALAAVVRKIIKEELENTMHPGAHTQGTTVPEAEQKLRAFVNAEGEYRKATTRTRKKKDEEEVELTPGEAKAVGITDTE